jgi:hypothetical protein
MNVIRPGKPSDGSNASGEVEGEIRALVRREVASDRRGPAQPQQPQAGSEVIAAQVNSLIQRVSVTSVKEIEKLMSELQSLRDFLQNESQRVQREIAGYVELSESAMKSTKIIAESMGQWKGGPREHE